MKRTVQCLILALCWAAWPGSGGSAAGAEQPVAHTTLVWEAEDVTALPHPLFVQAVPAADAPRDAWHEVTFSSYPGCIDALGSASGGRYVTRPGNAMVSQMRAVYRIRIPRSGIYFLWCRIWPGSVEWGNLGQVLVDGEPRGWAPCWRPRPPLFEPGQIWRWYWSPCTDQRQLRSARQGGEPAIASLELTEGVHVLEIGPPGGSYIEEPDKLDMLLLTTDPQLDPGQKEEPVRRTSGTVVLPQVQPAQMVVWEAEDVASVEPPLKVQAAPDASGGAGLVHPERDGGRATYAVEIPAAGSYYLWARVRHSHEPALWTVTLAGESQYLYYYGWGGRGWTWVRAFIGAPPRLKPFALPQGEASFAFRPSRYHPSNPLPDLAVDQWLLTTDPSFVPARTGRDAVAVYPAPVAPVADSRRK